MHGQAAALRVVQVAYPVRHGLERTLEVARQVLEVVARTLDLGEEIPVRKQQRAREVVRQVNLDQARRLGVARGEVGRGELVQVFLVDQPETYRVRELKLETLLEHRRGQRESRVLGVPAAHHRTGVVGLHDLD